MDVQQVTQSEPTWSGLTGTVLPGGYEIGGISQAEPGRARFRVRVLGDWHANAFLDAFCLPEDQAREQLALWTAAQNLKHPNVSSPLACGEVDIDSVSSTYVVALTPDQSLGGLLTERAATSAECLELLTSLRRALAYLHANGWVHGHLSPEQVLAFGDSIRISSEYIGQINTRRPLELTPAKYSAPEAVEGNNTPAADVWCLGATLFEALTQETFSSDKVMRIPDLPAPFGRFVARCLDPNVQTRCTLDEMDEILANRTKPALAVAAAAAAAAAAAGTAAPVTPARPPVREEPAPPTVLTRVAPRREESQDRAPRLWLYAAGLLLAVCLLLWLAWPRHRQVTPQGPAPAPTAATASRSSVPAASRAASAAPSAPAPVAPVRSDRVPEVRTQPVGPLKQSAVDHTLNGPVWRVVLFTYAREADAQRKAQSINEKHPDFQATVFRPGSDSGPYLVTVGGTMTRDDAAHLRRRVIGLGFPRDSYIQNYKQ
jgi:serine/threonine protein kinase